MKKCFTFYFLLFPLCFSQAQNLVPNGDFESVKSCTAVSAYISFFLNNWYNSSNSSPDPFNPCFWPGMKTPSNNFGYQTARSGVGYAGLAGFLTSNRREYISNALIAPLQAGKSYNVNFYISLADSSLFAINKFGLYFSTDSINDTTMYNLNFTPQINNPSNVILSDSINWYLVSGIYIAGGGEKFITVGNFYPDSLTTLDTLESGNINYGAYYYIDDVSVELDTTTGINETENSLSFEVYPNPANEKITIKLPEFKKYSVKIINLLGETVYYVKEEELKRSLEINTGVLDRGVYFIKIITEEKRGVKKLVLK